MALNSNTIGMALSALGLPAMAAGELRAMLVGLAFFGVGTFLAQAAATGHVSRRAAGDRGAASGLYLASYFSGGLAGSFVLGRVFDRFGWEACVAGIGMAILAGALLTYYLKESNSVPMPGAIIAAPSPPPRT